MIKALFIVSTTGQPRFSKFYEYIVCPFTGWLNCRRWKIERISFVESMRLW